MTPQQATSPKATRHPKMMPAIMPVGMGMLLVVLVGAPARPAARGVSAYEMVERCIGGIVGFSSSSCDYGAVY